MKNITLKLIADFATKELNRAYGYCGVASNDEQVYINSDDGNGNDIKIVITIKTPPTT